MSVSAKKSSSMGLTQKSEKHNDTTTPSGGTGSGQGSRSDSTSTTPSKASKQGTTKRVPASSANSLKNSSADPLLTNTAIFNQQALEALYSATYVEDFIECNDTMGDDLIRQTTRMFEMGSSYMTYIRELDSAMAVLLRDDGSSPIIAAEPFSADKKKAVYRLQQILMTAQDTGDDSLQVMQSIQDHIENKTRQLDVDRKNLAEFCKEQDIPDTTFKDPPPPPTERNIKRARRVVRHEIYRPSILGPASLKATSFPETLTTSTRDQEPHVVSSRSRDRERDRDRDSQRESYNTTGATATPVVSSVDIPGPTSTEEPSKPNGKSERVGGPSVRGSATSSLSDNTSCHDKSGGNGSSAYATSSSKKQSQKNQTQEKKTKKRKAKQSSNSSSKEDNSPQQYAIDPDEPTYCLCDQVSYGEMIGCDNDLCPIEWFHFSCVSLTTKPKGKWYCPKCRGDRPNIMKPKAIFLKELEKYNREKEEKA